MSRFRQQQHIQRSAIHQTLLPVTAEQRWHCLHSVEWTRPHFSTAPRGEVEQAVEHRGDAGGHDVSDTLLTVILLGDIKVNRLAESWLLLLESVPLQQFWSALIMSFFVGENEIVHIAALVFVQTL